MKDTVINVVAEELKPMEIKFVDLPKTYEHRMVDISKDINKLIMNGQFVYTHHIPDFEKSVAEYLNVGHAISVSSGTSALEVALKALGVRVHDKVVVPANSFIASGFSVSNVGGIPIFVDVDPDSWVLSPKIVLQAIEEYKPAVIMPVHLFGLPIPDIVEICRLASERGAVVLEDCAQAFGARIHVPGNYEGKRYQAVGTFGAINAFSFYPTKNLGCFGHGGLIASNIYALAREAQLIKNYGESEKYISDCIGTNNNMDSIQAVVLSHLLQDVDANNKARQVAAKRYIKNIQSSRLMNEFVRYQKTTSDHVYHLFVIALLDPTMRDELRTFLSGRGVPTALHYPLPIHKQKAYATGQTLPVAEWLAPRILSLPMHPKLTDEQVDYVCYHIEDYLHQKVGR